MAWDSLLINYKPCTRSYVAMKLISLLEKWSAAKLETCTLEAWDVSQYLQTLYKIEWDIQQVSHENYVYYFVDMSILDNLGVKLQSHFLPVIFRASFVCYDSMLNTTMTLDNVFPLFVILTRHLSPVKHKCMLYDARVRFYIGLR